MQPAVARVTTQSRMLTPDVDILVRTDLEHQSAHVIVEVKKASSVDIQNGIEGVPAPLE